MVDFRPSHEKTVIYTADVKEEESSSRGQRECSAVPDACSYETYYEGHEDNEGQ